MSRMTITIDDELVREAMAVLGTPTKSETIRWALREVLRRTRIEQALAHRGQIDLDLDQATLARLRADA